MRTLHARPASPAGVWGAGRAGTVRVRSSWRSCSAVYHRGGCGARKCHVHLRGIWRPGDAGWNIIRSACSRLEVEHRERRRVRAGGFEGGVRRHPREDTLVRLCREPKRRRRRAETAARMSAFCDSASRGGGAGSRSPRPSQGQECTCTAGATLIAALISSGRRSNKIWNKIWLREPVANVNRSVECGWCDTRARGRKAERREAETCERGGGREM
ncbi:hypothetical protein B0H11DRAFT_245810 [Mycena galericulata]|nr:hypothetical protein B0H11DRAFT_245810 [Mycena galericulata]